MGVSLINLLKQSKDTVCLTGAGMSTGSGIPDFQGTNGLWKGVNPVELSSLDALTKDPSKVINFWNDIANTVQDKEPNPGHYLLAKFHRLGLIDTIITQNVDGYHQRASKIIQDKYTDIVELHGNVNQHYCIECGQKYYAGAFTRCEKCGGWIRPDIVLYGEDLNQDYLKKAFVRATESDLMIVLGSSLTVSPAVDIVITALTTKSKVVIVNEGATKLDGYVDGVIHKDITEVLEGLYKELTNPNVM